MDVTALFKACVKTVKTKNKFAGPQNPNEKNSILGVRPSRSAESRQFAVKAKEIVSKVNQLREFLLKHRNDYINVRHLACDVSSMNDTERDQIDRDIEKYMKISSDTIGNMKTSFLKMHISHHVDDHRKAVVCLLEAYLKEVCELYSEQKAIRVKRSVETQKLSRLEPEFRNSNKDISTVEKKPDDVEKSSGKEDIPPSRARTFSYDKEYEVEELSPTEMQLYDQENQDLYNDLNSMVDEVRQVEGKVVEISRLQQIFTEKVLQQDKDVERISETVVGTTENIKDANNQIREAMKRNTGFRVYILFFLLVLSFSLLFLDWFNP